MSDRPTWRDRYPEGFVTCVRCLEVFDVLDLDRMLWCRDCRVRARNRATWWGWGGGLVFAAALALYVWVTIRPSDLIPGAWVATFAAAVWIGSKVGREIAYGVIRFVNTRAVEAVPPSAPPEARAEEDEGAAGGAEGEPPGD